MACEERPATVKCGGAKYRRERKPERCFAEPEAPDRR